MKLLFVLGLLLAAVLGQVYFKDDFSNTDNWVASQHQNGEFKRVLLNDDVKDQYGIKTNKDARFYAYSAKFEPFTNKDKDLIVSYLVKHTQERVSCGGSYIKLLGKDHDPKTFSGNSDYLLMIGPDQCGSTKKIHFIFSKDIPGNEEKNVNWNHLDNHRLRPPTDKKSHVYTFRITPNNEYEVYIDKQLKQSGSLTADFNLLPPKEIDDPENIKPADWVDEQYIHDPSDTKPEDWEEEFIADPEAVKPEEWNEEEDGEWAAPLITNPEYKPWTPKKIKNPEFKGKWVQKKIPNPDYDDSIAENLYVFEEISGVGFDLWQVDSGTVFSSVIVADDLQEVWDFVDGTVGKLKVVEDKSHQAEEERRRIEDEERRKKWEEEKSKDEPEDEADEEEVDEDDFDVDFDEL
ncbi:hypothetical protein GEMRC1_006866 [Eukaryota sp. GEM-RC1]